MSIRVSVNGAKGRLGQVACRALSEHSDFQLVGELGRNDDLREHCHTVKPDVILNVVPASAVRESTQQIIESGVRVVVGSSGLTENDCQHFEALCAQKKLGALFAPNFSMGSALMMTFSQIASRYFDGVEIVEYHHEKKQDAPSGTAQRTAKLIAAARAGKQAVPIHSVRLAGLLAHQEVLFGRPDETLMIRHDVFGREAYAPGILLACQAVMNLTQWVEGLESLIIPPL